MTIVSIPATPTVGEYTTTEVKAPQNTSATQQRENFVTVATNSFDGQYQSISDAVTALASTGGTIFVKEGTYLEVAPIEMPNVDITLVGAGVDLVTLKSRYPGGSSISAIDLNDVYGSIVIRNINFVVPIGSAIVGGSVGATDGRASATGDFTVEDCKFICSAYPIFINMSCDSIVVDNCDVTDCGEPIYLGAYTNDIGTKTVKVINNRVLDVLLAGEYMGIVCAFLNSGNTYYPEITCKDNDVFNVGISCKSRGGSIVAESNMIEFNTDWNINGVLYGVFLRGGKSARAASNIISYNGEILNGNQLSIYGVFVGTIYGAERGTTVVSENTVTMDITDSSGAAAFAISGIGVSSADGQQVLNNNITAAVATSAASTALTLTGYSGSCTNGAQNITSNYIEMDDTLTTGTSKPTGILVSNGNNNIATGNTIINATTGIDFTSTTGNIGDTSNNIII